MDNDMTNLLLQQELDGENSPEESSLLAQELASNPAVRRRLEEMKSVVRVLGYVRDVDPPPTLKPSIFRALEARRELPHPGRLWVERFLDILSPKPVVRYGLILAAGMAVGILGFAAVSAYLMPAHWNPADLSGALAISHATPGFVAGPAVQISVEGIRGSVAAELSGDQCLLHVDLQANRPVGLILKFDPAALQIQESRNLRNVGGTLLVGKGEVRLQCAGKSGCTLLMAHEPGREGAVDIAVETAGRVDFEQRLTLSAPSAR
jgi:hypothetical protein